MKKLSVALLLAAVSSISAGAVYAQLTPNPNPVPVPRPERGNIMVWTNDDAGYLGVQTVSVTGENAAKYGLKEVRGVAVEKVLEGSPAAAAGLQSGDVIIAFDGEEVKSAAKLTRMIAEVAPDQKAKITVLRGGNERELTVTLGKRPQTAFPQFESLGNLPQVRQFPQGQEFKLDDEFFKNLPKGEFPQFPQQGGFSFGFNQGRKIGVVADGLTKQLGEHFGVADGKGLLVSEVRADSPAGKAGLRAGDIIVQVDGQPVANTDEMVKAINLKNEGDIELTYIRDKNRRTVRITPEQTKAGDNPTLFRIAPGADGERRTIVIPRNGAEPAKY